MSTHQARRERREAERRAKKAALHREKLSLVATPLTEPNLPQEDALGFVSRETIDGSDAATIEAAEQATLAGFVSQKQLPAALDRLAINRTNAERSTGPRTPAGKSASSCNATRHGLASGVLILPDENAGEFDTFLTELLEEFVPATATEDVLVNEIAQSHWLSLRALRLQECCFTANGVDGAQLALLLRYETTHTRAFYKALEALRRLQHDRLKRASLWESPRKPSGFVSQNRPRRTGFVSQFEPEPETPFPRKRDVA